MTPEAPHQLVLDACCVINLFASRRLGEILAVLGRPIAVAAYVANEEALYIYGGPADNIRHTREEIELKPLIDANVLYLDHAGAATPVGGASPAHETNYPGYVGIRAAEGQLQHRPQTQLIWLVAGLPGRVISVRPYEPPCFATDSRNWLTK